MKPPAPVTQMRRFCPAKYGRKGYFASLDVSLESAIFAIFVFFSFSLSERTGSVQRNGENGKMEEREREERERGGTVFSLEKKIEIVKICHLLLGRREKKRWQLAVRRCSLFFTLTNETLARSLSCRIVLETHSRVLPQSYLHGKGQNKNN